jgi:hypothetical protein
MKMIALVRPKGFEPRHLFNAKLAIHLGRDSSVVLRHFWIDLSTLMQTNRVMSFNP